MYIYIYNTQVTYTHIIHMIFAPQPRGCDQHAGASIKGQEVPFRTPVLGNGERKHGNLYGIPNIVEIYLNFQIFGTHQELLGEKKTCGESMDFHRM